MVGIWAAVGGGGSLFSVAGRHVYFTTQNGFYIIFFGLIEELHRTEYIAMVRDGHRFHAKAFRLFQHAADPDGAIQKAEFRMDVKMGKGCVIAQGSLSKMFL